MKYIIHVLLLLFFPSKIEGLRPFPWLMSLKTFLTDFLKSVLISTSALPVHMTDHVTYEMLIKYYEYCSGPPVAGHNRATLKCSMLSHNSNPQILQVFKVCANGILTAGVSTRAVVHKLNNHFFGISHLQCHFPELVVDPTGLTTAQHV